MGDAFVILVYDRDSNSRLGRLVVMVDGPRYTVSGRIFRASMETLIPSDPTSRSGFDNEAIDRVAARRGVTRRTVIRWRRGETQPSNRSRDLERQAALRAGRAQAIQVRSADGSFRAEGTIATGGSQRAVESVNRRLRRTRQAEIERARRSGSPAQLRSARALPTRLSRDEASDLALRRERLIDAEVEGDDFFFEFEDSWEAWRIDYEEAGG